MLGTPVSPCLAVEFVAAVHQFSILELLLNASAQLLWAPPQPLIVCDL